MWLTFFFNIQQGICKMYVEKKKSTEEEGMLGEKDKADDE